MAAIVRDARRRGFLPYEELNPPANGVLAQVVCRYCREGFDPYARLLQRLHHAGHRQHGTPLLRRQGPRARRSRRERYGLSRRLRR